MNSGVSRPFLKMQRLTVELRNLNSVTDILRSIGRVTYLVERLKATMRVGPDNEISLEGVSARDMTRAAGFLAEIKNILDEADLSNLDAIVQHVELCNALNVAVRQFANTQLTHGLENQDMEGIASALQIFFNFGELYKVIQEAVEAIEKRVSTSFRKMLDVSTIGDPAKLAGKSGKVEKLNASTLRAAFWDRVDSLSEELFRHVLQVWTLQGVLLRKQDPLTFVVFIDAYNTERQIAEAKQALSGKRVSFESLLEYFWVRLTAIVSSELTHGSQSSSFVRGVFVNEFPRLASIFETLFTRIVKQQLGSSLSTPSLAASQPEAFGAQSREALLGGLQVFRTGFLAHSLRELTDPVNLMFGGTQMVPSRSDVSALISKMHEQMALVKDSSPDLQDAVCEGVVQAIGQFEARCLALLQKAEPRVTPALRTNSELFNIACFLVKEFHPVSLKKSWGELCPSASGRMAQCWAILQGLANTVVNTLMTEFLTSTQDIFKAMNKEDFGVSAVVAVEGSPYLSGLRSQLSQLLGPVLALFQFNGLTAPTEALNPTQLRPQTILAHLGKLQEALAELFVLHASLLFPLKDQGRLKLAADLAVLDGILREIPRAGTRGSEMLAPLSFFKEVLLADLDRLRTMTDRLVALHGSEANFQKVCLAQYLFDCAGLPRSSPALVLELPPEVYVQKVTALLPQQPEEVFAMLRSVYTRLEAQVKIPAGPEGRDFIANNRVHLHLAMLLLPKP